MAKDVNAELSAAFDVLRQKLQRVLDRSLAKDVEIKQLKVELAIAHEDIESTIVIVNPISKGTTMAKTPPQSAQNSPDGTTIPPATQIRVLGSGLFTLSNGVILLNGSAEAAGNKQATELEWLGGVLKAHDSNGDVTVWTANVNPVDPQGSWSATAAP
jgi:hypothetical protein